MVTADIQPFMTASVAASSALIGLLFVSVSIAPERVFGNEADARRHAQAVSAFTALVNVFFISLTSLIPEVLIGIVVTIVAAVSGVQTLALLRFVRSWRQDRTLYSGVILFLASAAVYGGELVLGVDLWTKPNRAELIGLLQVLLGAYGIGLSRAWQLLGAPRLGLLSYLTDRLDRARRPAEPKH